MERKIIRNKKYVKIIGIITTVGFSMMSIFFGIVAGMIASICFLPFVALGIILLIGYEREKIIIEKDTLTFCYSLKKTRVIKYHDIHCLLFVPLGNKTSMVLIDNNYNRLNELDSTLDNLDVLFEMLAEKGVSIIDFEELVEQNKNVSKYISALNWIEKNYYKSIFDEKETTEKLQRTVEKDKIEKVRQRLKIFGLGFIIADALAFLFGGKSMYIIYILVILSTYALYVWYYPYIYFETKSKKVEDVILQLPLFGALIASLFCMFVFQICDCDFYDLLKFIFISAVILSIPFIFKSLKLKIHQRKARIISVIFATLYISFIIAMPINILLTFDRATHEEIVVIDKDIDTGSSLTDYQLIANWRGEKQSFNVSKNEYLKTSVGDTRRVCVRKSLFGLEYYTVHD